MSAAELTEHVQVLPGGLTEDAGAAAVTRLLAEHDPPTGLTVFNDRSAVGALQTLRVKGKGVPADVSVVGFDDDHLARLPYVDLTTIRQDAASLARHAVTRALARLPDPAPPAPDGAAAATSGRAASIVVPPALVVRSTTAPPG